MKIILWGTGDQGKPRSRILLSALRTAGASVEEIHHDVWHGVEDKSRLGAVQRASRYARWLTAYPALIWRFMVAPKPDAVLLVYPAQLDVLMLWILARLRRVPILMDLFISLYDTTIIDRRLAPPTSLKARLLWSLEWLACRAADKVIIDTEPHARYVEELFRLPPGSVGGLPVGVERGQFQYQAPTVSSGRPQLLFYGQLIPLQGVDVILQAARSPRGEAYDWVIIGSGQDSSKVEAALDGGTANHVTWIAWAPYSELSTWIARSNLCLGIFGGSRKAASVVPNKVYQSLSCGRHVVTRASPAAAELVGHGDAGVTLVEPQSSEALLDGIEAAVKNGCPPPSLALLNSFSAERIGDRLLDYFRAMQSEYLFQATSDRRAITNANTGR